MLNGAYELLVSISRQFGRSILRGGRRNFRREFGRGGRNRIMYTQARLRGDQDGRSLKEGIHPPQGDTVL